MLMFNDIVEACGFIEACGFTEFRGGRYFNDKKIPSDDPDFN